jgi:hypothetical protein
MKKILFGCLSLALISFFSSAYAGSAYAASAYAAKPARVDVLYMNHGPLMDTLDKMKSVFSSYGDRISVSWYEFYSKQGEDFKAKKGINQHVPLVIWIDGKEVVNLGQKQVKFVGFPTGAGPAFFQGKWTIDDLKAALDQVTAKK